MKNFSSYYGCSCHLNPPCNMCTNTFECEKCGNIYDNESASDENDFICEDCEGEEGD